VKHFRFVLAAMLTLKLAGSAQMTGSGQKTVTVQTIPDPSRVLQTTGERLLADLERMPRYTCVKLLPGFTTRENSTSSIHPALHSSRHTMRENKKLPVQGWGRLRLEVALVDSQSVHSSAARSFLLAPIASQATRFRMDYRCARRGKRQEIIAGVAVL